MRRIKSIDFMRCVLIISKMQDMSNVLLIIQASLMGVSLTLFFALVLSSLQKADTTRAYEIVRWLLAFAMLHNADGFRFSSSRRRCWRSY